QQILAPIREESGWLAALGELERKACHLRSAIEISSVAMAISVTVTAAKFNATRPEAGIWERAGAPNPLTTELDPQWKENWLARTRHLAGSRHKGKRNLLLVFLFSRCFCFFDSRLHLELFQLKSMCILLQF